METRVTSSRFVIGTHLLLGVTALLLSSCDLEVRSSEEGIPEGSAIHGTVLAEGPTVGDVSLMLYLCDDPPPPQGTGRPIDFIIVNRIEFAGGQAPFIFPLVEAGDNATGSEPAQAICYLITGFMDVDADWNPFYDVAGQVTGGDLAATPVQVEVFGAEEPGGLPALVTDVRVVLDVPVIHDLPSFQLTPTHVSAGASPCATPVEEGAPLQVQVGMQTDHTAGYDALCANLDARPLTSELLDNSDPAFGVVFAPDLDEDGQPDDVNGDGASGDALYPQVLFIRLDPADPDQLTLAEPAVILPGVVAPYDPADLGNEYGILFDYIAAGLPFDGETVFWVDKIKIVIPELVVTDLFAEPPTTAPLEGYAAETGIEVEGAYQVLVLQANGQVWSTPNVLLEYGVEGQDQIFTVVP